jgi:hypothetical protein
VGKLVALAVGFALLKQARSKLMASLEPYALASAYLLLELDVVLSGEGFF